MLTLILKLFSAYEAILVSDSFFRIASYPVNNFRTNVSTPLATVDRVVSALLHNRASGMHPSSASPISHFLLKRGLTGGIDGAVFV